ncbi:MAG: hypothetical protein HZC29_00290, partial [Thaumarchaeota archaeon]|nr:hypothetical protein [Nitrososphaerota archaeon]
MFTIINKENSFSLTLNNVLKPQGELTFSVFDGITWQKVKSSTAIGENSSHVAATFNGTDISIYINGTTSQSIKTTQTLSLDSKGIVEQKTPQLSNSDSDVVIGAKLDSRAIDNAEEAFSGTIEHVEIYNVYLTAEQVYQIYITTLPEILAKVALQTIEIPEIKEIDLLANQTKVNGTLIANVTEPIIVPVNEDTNQITLSVWVDPEYTRAADELTILSKEKSFALSLNNILSPEHVAKFSVFDGIKWTDVYGTSKIEDLSHLAAVINGCNISLYVNGTLDKTAKLPNSLSITKTGVTLVPAEVAQSGSDVVIGGYMSDLRSEINLVNKFSGIINNAKIFTTALDESAIKQIYANNLSVDTSISFVESLTLADVVQSYQIMNNTLQNTTNSTETLSFVDVLTVFQNPNSTQQNTTGSSFAETLFFADVLTSVKNSNFTLELPLHSIDESLGFIDTLTVEKITAQEIILEVQPELIPLKNSYLITDDAEFELEFYDEAQVLMKQQQELEEITGLLESNVTQDLSQVQTNLEIQDIPRPQNKTEGKITKTLSDIEKLFTIQTADAKELTANGKL